METRGKVELMKENTLPEVFYLIIPLMIAVRPALSGCFFISSAPPTPLKNKTGQWSTCLKYYYGSFLEGRYVRVMPARSSAAIKV
jgi:hypothetical protein